MEYTKADLNWLMSKMECTSERYMEAERMIIEIIEMPWWKRLFCGRKLLRFLKSRDKYNFNCVYSVLYGEAYRFNGITTVCI